MTAHRSATQPVGADLTRLLKALKLGALADTLPERAALARQQKLSHIGFLETLLADEVSRRESRSRCTARGQSRTRPRHAPGHLDRTENLRYDRTLLNDLASLRFLDEHQSAIILGPVGVGKTHLATAGWATTQSVDDTPFCSLAPTNCSPGCAPPAWTTPSTPKSAA